MEIDTPDEHKDSLESSGFSMEERDLLDLIAGLIVGCVLKEENQEAQRRINLKIVNIGYLIVRPFF